MKNRVLFRMCTRTFFKSNNKSETSGKDNYYSILGVEKDATPLQIKQSYFELAKTHHPDVRSDTIDSSIDFELINEAYQTLKNPDSRKLYDRTGLSSDEQQQAGNGYNFSQAAEDNYKKRLEKLKVAFNVYKNIFDYDKEIFNSYLKRKPKAVDQEGNPLSINCDHTQNIEHAIGIEFQELKGAMMRSDFKEKYIAKRVAYNRIIICTD